MSRWLRYAGLALLAVVTIGVELDHAAIRQPALAPMVPALFRSEAQVPTALVALTGATPSAALAQSRRLVRRKPMPAEGLFVLALAQARAGDEAGFTRTFAEASTRGWRLPPLQAAAARGALDAGDAAGAANRVAALWGTAPDDPAVPDLTRRLLATPGGAEAFGRHLAATTIWRDTFLARAGAVAAPQDAARTIHAAQAAGARFDCTALARVTTVLPAAVPCQ